MKKTNPEIKTLKRKRDNLRAEIMKLRKLGADSGELSPLRKERLRLDKKISRESAKLNRKTMTPFFTFDQNGDIK